jgi:hypothetical protein
MDLAFPPGADAAGDVDESAIAGVAAIASNDNANRQTNHGMILS